MHVMYVMALDFSTSDLCSKIFQPHPYRATYINDYNYVACMLTNTHLFWHMSVHPYAYSLYSGSDCSIRVF